MRVIAILICFATGTMLSLRHVVYASCFFIWHEIFRPIDFAYRAFNFPSAQLVVATLIVSLIITRWERRWNPVATALTVMLFWMCVCSFFAVHKDEAWEYTLFASKFLIPLIFISTSLTTRWGQNMFVYTLAASVGLWAAQAGFHVLTHGAPEDSMAIRGGQMSDRNDFVAGIIACLPLLGYIASTYAWKGRKWVRWITKAVFGLSIVAIIYSLSRGGIIGLAALLCYYMVATGRLGKKLLFGAAVVMLAVSFMPGFVVERMETIDWSTDVQTEGSAAARLNLVRVGVEMTLDNPITGVGPGNFPHMAPQYNHPINSDPHNIWLKASGEYGFPMLILFILIVAMLVHRLARERKLAKKRGDQETERLAISLSCSIVGFLVTTTFLSQFMSEYFWAICSVAGAFLAHMEFRRRNPELEPADATVPADKALEAAVS